VTRRGWIDRTFHALPLEVRWRIRNGRETARWLWLRATRRADCEYGGEFWDFHAGGDWNRFAELLLRYCAPRSIVDVGCGDGKLLAAMLARAPGLPALGIDSSPEALHRAAAAGVPIEEHDLSSLSRDSLGALRARIERFDVVVSFETAEHLPQWAARSFVSSLSRGRLVVFSAARPSQGGTLHLNEQPPEYWRRRFARRGFAPAPFESELREELSRLHLPSWYADNLQVFERRA